MKIAIISCYDQIDYIRTLTLRPAFAAAKNVQTIIVKNKHKGLLRYLEVPYRILRTKFTEHPDVYVITFRGYEMLPFVLMVKGRKPLIFDEYVNAAEYLQEHGVLPLDSRLGKLFLWWYTTLLKRCRFILADTEAHAHYSASLTGVDREKYVALPVSTDEKLFYPGAAKHTADTQGKFRVFYYGVMKRLYGLEYLLDAAVALSKTHPNVEFTISDPRGDQAKALQAAIDKGANIQIHSGWIQFDTLPRRHIEADLSIGGPFGKTLQSQFVIATKTFQILACAVPALVAKNLTANEGFEDKKNCLLVPQADAKAIAQAIGWAADHPKELQAIGKNGRKLYEARFSQARVAKDVQRMVSALEQSS
jgi:glycosyltransferase involved in cell wall biosynthesis